MYRCFILLLFVFSSCDYLPRSSGRPVTLTVNDTIFVVKEKVITKTVVDTVFKTVERTSPKSGHQVFIDTLTAYLGTREATGMNDGETVERFIDNTCDLGNVAWCGAFLSYGLLQTGNEIPELPCWSPSFFPKERVVWSRGDKRELYKGEIFGLYFESKGRIAHVGAIVEDFGDGWVLTIEGNTNSAGAREGNGVFKRLRHKSQLYVASDWVI